MTKGLKVNAGPSGGYSPGSYYKETELAQIDVKSEESLHKWETILHINRKELLAAIETFGPIVRNIRRGLLLQDDDAA